MAIAFSLIENLLCVFSFERLFLERFFRQNLKTLCQVYQNNVLDNDYQMIRASVGALLFNTLIWKDKNVVDQSHPFAADEMKVIYDKYEKLDDESDEKKHIFKTVLYSLNKIISFGVPTTWLWLPVLVSKNFLRNKLYANLAKRNTSS